MSANWMSDDLVESRRPQSYYSTDKWQTPSLRTILFIFWPVLWWLVNHRRRKNSFCTRLPKVVSDRQGQYWRFFDRVWSFHHENWVRRRTGKWCEPNREIDICSRVGLEQEMSVTKRDWSNQSVVVASTSLNKDSRERRSVKPAFYHDATWIAVVSNVVFERKYECRSRHKTTE